MKVEHYNFIDFKNKYVLVTGATSGIGMAIAVELSKVGARVILSGRDGNRINEALKHLQGEGHQPLCLELSTPSEIMPTIKELVKKIGAIYGLCHAAGIVKTRPLGACSTKSVQEMLDVNLIAGIELARVVARRDIIDKVEGSILFIAAAYGVVGMPGEVGYSATKGAVIASARSMAVELAGRNIRVNVISPGMVMTRMAENAFKFLSEEQVDAITDAHPLGVGKAEDVARSAAFLLAPQSSWITGTNLIVDGGFTAR